MSESSFSEFSAQDSHLAALEAQEWIEVGTEQVKPALLQCVFYFFTQ